MTFDPKSVEVTRVTLPKDHCVQYSDPTFHKLEPKVIDP